MQKVYSFMWWNMSGFIRKLGNNFAICITWIDETWWNNRLLLVPNCCEVVAMVATMVAMVAPLWCHTYKKPTLNHHNHKHNHHHHELLLSWICCSNYRKGMSPWWPLLKLLNRYSIIQVIVTHLKIRYPHISSTSTRSWSELEWYDKGVRVPWQ